MGGFGDVRAAATVLLVTLAVTDAQSQWCPEAAAPTATAYNCENGVTGTPRVGLVCPSDAEAAQWGDAAVAQWAGHEMVKCRDDASRVVKGCDGVNDCGVRCRIEADGSEVCSPDNGGDRRCRIEADGTIVCGSDEQGCGGLVNQIEDGSVLDPLASPTPGVGKPTCTGVRTDGGQCDTDGNDGVVATADECDTAAGCTFTPACGGTDTSNCNGAISMGTSTVLMVGPTLQSTWITPYADQVTNAATYSQAMCLMYAEIANTQVRQSPSHQSRLDLS